MGYLFICLFIYLFLPWVLVVTCRLLSSCGVQAPECVGSVILARRLSSCGTQALEHVGSVVAARA